MSNMKVWDAVSRPPKEALKQIGGGRLKGMTDINPQWRYEVMTQAFGVCGFGWKLEIKRLWTENGFQKEGETEVFAFAEVHVFVKMDGEWSDAIPGIGGNLLIESEHKGMHNNDEAFKMAVTDAIGTAIKMLGVGSDIYAGRWDGSKFKDKPAEKPVAVPVVEYDDMDEADQGWVDAINQSDDATKLYALGQELRKESTVRQLVALPYYRNVWIKFFKSAATNEDLDAMGVILAKEPKDIVSKEIRDAWTAKKKEFGKAATKK